jgi:hypothetical protein
VRPSRIVPSLALAALSVAACSDPATAPADPNGVAYSFVVVGCNRLDKADTNTTVNASTANLAQLSKTLEEVAALKPKLLFFAGDMVFGYTPDTVALASQLTAWKALYEASPVKAAGTELVAVPGNHETQNTAKIAYAAAERTWLRIMAPYLTRGGNGPGAGGADTLKTDQSRLTYSFDYQDAHFVTLNTDPVGADWSVPVAWVATDLGAARTRGVKHIFAISHKPAYEYPGAASAGDGLSKYPVLRNALWTALTASNAEALFSSHNHVWWAGQPVANGPWQIIAGNGGSKLEVDPTVPRTGNYYGFTYVMVLNSGKVIARSYGRDVPAHYNAMATIASTVRDTVVVK